MAYFGQTRTRGGDPRISSNTSIEEIRTFCDNDIAAGNPNSPACGSLAINSSNEVAADLCRQGVSEGCRSANIPELTAAESAEMARRREEQAQRDRELTARNLENTCELFNSPEACMRIAQAIRNPGQDVIYARDVDDAVKQLQTEDVAPEIIEAAVSELESRQPWHSRILESYRPWYKRKWIYLAAAIVGVGAYYYFKP